eukprot:scaffold6567_cov251-Prasinococcus_capsulatus_cf.AAC.2
MPLAEAVSERACSQRAAARGLCDQSSCKVPPALPTPTLELERGGRGASIGPPPVRQQQQQHHSEQQQLLRGAASSSPPPPPQGEGGLARGADADDAGGEAPLGGPSPACADADGDGLPRLGVLLALALARGARRASQDLAPAPHPRRRLARTGCSSAAGPHKARAARARRGTRSATGPRRHSRASTDSPLGPGVPAAAAAA